MNQGTLCICATGGPLKRLQLKTCAAAVAKRCSLRGNRFRPEKQKEVCALHITGAMDASAATRAPARACHACLLRADRGRSLNARSSWRRICDECSQSYLKQPLLVPNERVRICPDTVGAWGQSREIYQAWDLPGAVVPARKYRLPALQGKVAVVFQDKANAENVDLLLGPLSVKPDNPFVLRYCSSIKSFCASDCFGSPKDKSCLAHIKQRTRRGGHNEGSVYGLEWSCGDAKRKRPNPEEFGARWVQPCQSSTDATVYVQAYKDVHLKEAVYPKDPVSMPMPYKWMATPQPGPRAQQGVGYSFPAASRPATAPHARPNQLGPGAVYRAGINPFGTPAQVGSAGMSAAHPAPSVQAENARLQGGTLMAVNGAAPLPYQLQSHEHQLQSLPPHQLFLPMPLPYLLGGMPPPHSFMPPGSMGPMAHAMPLGSLPPPTIGMPLPPMHRPYPGLAVW